MKQIEHQGFIKRRDHLLQILMKLMKFQELLPVILLIGVPKEC